MAADSAHEKLAKSAGRSEENAAQQTDSADRRTELAAERTYAAWVRNGLAALASGIGARALLEPIVAHWLVSATGSVLMVFSSFCFGAAVWREARGLRRARTSAGSPAW